jgi:hypothetical protein
MSQIKEKDPSFLLYSKDWLEGTADLMPDEKGVYIDLLCHQHQKGSLPADTARLARLVGLSEDKFLPIWEQLKIKFGRVNGSRVVNHKLSRVVAERAAFSISKKIAGEFAFLLRENGYSEQKRYEIKKSFKMEDFMGFKPDEIRGELKKWLSRW